MIIGRYVPWAFLCFKMSTASPLTSNPSSWVDPDTPIDARTTIALSPGDKRHYALIFSDEFEIEGRTFRDGEDPRWTALNKNDFTNNPLHYYSHDPDTVTSRNGSLSITVNIEPKHDLLHPDPLSTTTESKEFKSGMLQTWNKFCFTGGIVEFSAKMPANEKQAGYWPAIWMMGNLGRATFVNSTEQVWPFSSNVCDERTANSQLINSCANATRVVGMPPGRGRGAPEIDLLEVMNMDDYFEHPILSTSLQVAPGVPDRERPLLGQEPNASETWYSPEFGDDASRNRYFYGTVSYPLDQNATAYRTDSLSVNSILGKEFYDSFHKFRIEWEPPEESGYGGYIKWFIDDKFVTAVYGDDLQTTSQTEVPSEPMYLIMNVAVSKDWGFPDAYFKNCPKKCWSCLDPECACALPKGFCDMMPTCLDIDSVRVYQPADPKYSLGCSPPDRPTAAYIEAYKEKYTPPNFGDKPILKDIQVGGGSCTTDQDCGTTSTVERGTCKNHNDSSSNCVCSGDWVGPNCLAFHDNGLGDDWTDPFGYYASHQGHSGAFWKTFTLLGFFLCLAFFVRRKSKATEGDDLLKPNSYTTILGSPASTASYGTQSEEDVESNNDSPCKLFESYQD